MEVGEEPTRGLFLGWIGMYYQGVENEKDSFVEDGEATELNDSEVVVPFVQAEYLSPQHAGFRAGAGLTAFTHLRNNSETRRDSSDYDKLVVHKLYLQYGVSRTALAVGRQALEDSVFLSEYYEAAVLTSGEANNMSVLLAVVRKFADSDISNYIEFRDINEGDKAAGAMLYAAELTWEAVPESVEATLYYYKQKDLFDLYGAHIELSHETGNFGYGLEADYYATDEDGDNGLSDADGVVKNSYVYHISPLLEAGGFTLAAGFIQAARDVGAREGDVMDDYFNPLNEGDKLYEPDARTWYGALYYESDRLEAGVACGTTRYLDGSRHLREEEYGVKAEWEFVEDWMLAAEFSVVKSEAPEGDYNLAELVLKYEF